MTDDKKHTGTWNDPQVHEAFKASAWDVTTTGTALPMTVRTGSKEIFRLQADGSAVADWPALRECYDKFMAGDRDSVIIVGASLWLARNT